MTALNTQPGADAFNAGAGWTGLLFSETALDNITAFGGGGQVNATLLSTMFSRVTTVASPGDSVKPPPALPGLDLLVTNVGANPMAVFGSTTDQIDGAGANNSVSHMANSTVLYSCYGQTTGWVSEGLPTGFAASGLQTLSNQALTASTRHTQADAPAPTATPI